MPTLRIGTCITENYLRRATGCLRSLPGCGADPFVVTYGFLADATLRKLHPNLTWHHLPANQPADCHGCVQYGAWLDAVPHDQNDILVMADADAVYQRELNLAERTVFRSLGSNEVVIGRNAGADDTLRREARRLRMRDGAPDQALDEMYPGFADVPCFNCGFIAARAGWWHRLRAAYVKAWPQFNRLFSHRARCQWLTCWLIHEMKSRVIVLPCSVHAHGHFGMPPGCARDRDGTILAGGSPVFFAHHFK